MLFAIKKHYENAQEQKIHLDRKQEKFRQYIQNGQAFTQHWLEIARQLENKNLENKAKYREVDERAKVARRIAQKKKRVGSLLAQLEYETFRVHQ